MAATVSAHCPRVVADGIKVSLEIENRVRTFGDKLPVRVSVHNVGTALVTLPVLMIPEDYWLRFEIRDSKGALLKFSGPEVNPMFKWTRFSLAPGHFFGVEIENLSTYYAFPAPGTFTIQAIYGKPPTSECRFVTHRSPAIQITFAY